MKLEDYPDVNVKACLNIALANGLISFKGLIDACKQIGQDKLIKDLTKEDIEVIKNSLKIEE